MYVENLSVNHQKFISHLEDNDYSVDFIDRIRRMIKIILEKSGSMGWNSYFDVFQYFEKKQCGDIVKKKTVIGAIMEFDLNGKYPDRTPSGLTQKGAYYKLSPVFRLLVDRYKTAAQNCGKKESSIRVESSNASSFLFRIQEAGINRLDGITEETVINLFLAKNSKQRMNTSQSKCIANVIRANMTFAPDICQKVLAVIPAVKRATKNVQYINDHEAQAILLALADMSNSLCLRDRAIGNLAYFTGMRSSDMTGLDLASIDWNRDLIITHQRKTGSLLELPLKTPVGNAIFDYLTIERPAAKCQALFLTKNKPYRRMSNAWIVSAEVLAEAGIRQSNADRRGFHIFRHHLATSLLDNGIPQAVITDTLGHTSPDSLETYLSADINHLRECALSISRFPVAGEVFADA
ncbi:MAG: tyrosine-type recombinase/integrase [Bacillota bacterium]|nr:tyrosine-type recombinase/integrase [Bacillota bacterium]